MDEGLNNMIGRLSLVRATLPTAATESLVAPPPQVDQPAAGEGVPAPGTTAEAPSARSVSPAPMAPPRAAPAPPAPTGILTGAGPGELTEEEQVLIVAFRLLGRSLDRVALTPVDRAFIEAAHVLFDHLTDLCKDLCRRSVPEHLGRIADPSGPPRSADAPPPSKPKRAPRSAPKASTEGGTPA